ncbi:MAG: cbb3-type cytochrome c oxidase subunit 3 [Rhodospirillales bacterium]|nr:cbb3-type cytochrome c oxidase subunit 3 [Rhodospirillales bacterium]MDK9721387.1 cbb3-type cytochrome c oxidase subunit 3 [Rhodospirillales bacterium]
MSLQEFYEWARSLWTVWIFVVFIGIVAWSFWPKNKAKLEEYGNIPLKDD